MSIWTAYEIELRARSPVHIGYRQLGILSKTRHYIPSKNLWACMTSYLGKKLYEGKDYAAVGNDLDASIKFSYFYIKRVAILLPKYENSCIMRYNNIGMGSFDFEREFISSHTGTAIDQTTRTALEEKEETGGGSLHTTEYIKSGTLFSGYVFLSEKPELHDLTDNWQTWLKNALSLEKLGGERNYGFGELELVTVDEVTKKEPIFEHYSLGASKGDNTSPILEASRAFPVLAHTLLSTDTCDVLGDIEPLVGREWGDRGPGQAPTQNVKLCAVPGSTINGATRFKVGRYGIWEVVG
jgi:hypothetical protein